MTAVARLLAVVALAGTLHAAPPADWRSAPASAWTSIFDGRSLDGWVVKLAHHAVSDNYGHTFRVRDGAIRVDYDEYDTFGARFGHLFYDRRLSHYVLALEYRFFGQQMAGGPSYAKLNSGVMIHSQDPRSILKDQDWPVSVEAQFLAGGRTTMNVCTPGTEIFMKGAMVKAHCTDSTSKVHADGDWVRVEVEVLGGERVRHYADGQLVLEYETPAIGGGVATGFDPSVKVDGKRLTEGYVGLQAESQPVEFRNIRLLDLTGCADPASPAYRPWVVYADNTRCH
jgi:hypothetical protein